MFRYAIKGSQGAKPTINGKWIKIKDLKKDGLNVTRYFIRNAHEATPSKRGTWVKYQEAVEFVAGVSIYKMWI